MCTYEEWCVITLYHSRWLALKIKGKMRKYCLLNQTNKHPYNTEMEIFENYSKCSLTKWCSFSVWCHQLQSMFFFHRKTVYFTNLFKTGRTNFFFQHQKITFIVDPFYNSFYSMYPVYTDSMKYAQINKKKHDCTHDRYLYY